jgi:hypothetical protein
MRHERPVGRMHRVVAPPHAGTVEQGRASFDNGILEVRLKTPGLERDRYMPIELPFSRAPVHRLQYRSRMPQRDREIGDQGFGLRHPRRDFIRFPAEQQNRPPAG